MAASSVTKHCSTAAAARHTSTAPGPCSFSRFSNVFTMFWKSNQRRREERQGENTSRLTRLALD
eukprot:5660841-Pyramimonas_sp.AAC.1